MKRVADMRADQPAERTARLGLIRSGPASQAFERIKAPKYPKGRPLHVAWENLKPNIYYKAQDSTLGAHRAQGRRRVSRADIRSNGAAGDEGALVDLDVNTEPGRTETSLAPEMAAHAGSPLDEPVAGMTEDGPCDC
jgi:D-alanine-D-alanine ligase